MGKVTVMGSYIQDIAAYTPEFPVDGQTIVGYELKLGPGGKGSNQATASAKFNAETVMITKVGKDSFATNAYEHYKNVGISDKYVFVDENTSTGAAPIIIHKERGENRIVVILGANATLTKEEIDKAEEEIKSSDVLLTQYETNTEAILEFLRLGRKYGKKIIVNPAPMMEKPDEVYKDIDYVTPNETEAAVMVGMEKIETLEEARQAAELILKKGCKAVLMTLGSNGSYFYDGKKEINIKPIKVKAVDTTGAGDTFNGAFAAAIAEGFDDETAIKYATCMAGISVTRQGSSPSIPTREEVDECFKKNFG